MRLPPEPERQFIYQKFLMLDPRTIENAQNAQIKLGKVKLTQDGISIGSIRTKKLFWNEIKLIQDTETGFAIVTNNNGGHNISHIDQPNSFAIRRIILEKIDS